MAQNKYDVLGLDGSVKESIELNPQVFDVCVKPSLIHDVVKWQLARRRQGTHATLNISRMTNTSKKMYKQKGTGRSRMGHNYSPTRVGGAVAHGPQPRSYDFKLNKKVKIAALAGALSNKVKTKDLVIVSSLINDSGKTKDMQKSFKNLGVKKKVLVVLTGKEELKDVEKKLALSARNIANSKILKVSGINVYDLVNFNTLVCDKSAIGLIENRILGLQEVK